MSEVVAVSQLATLRWTRREPPLAPVALVAWGPSFARVLTRIADDDELRKEVLVIVASRTVVVIGDELPWDPDVAWLGLESGLYVPTMIRPTIDASVVARRIRSSAAAAPNPATGIPPANVFVLTPNAAYAAVRPLGPPDPAVLRQLAAAEVTPVAGRRTTVNR